MCKWRHSSVRAHNLAFKNVVAANFFAIYLPVGTIVDTHHCTFKRDSGKEPFRTRVREDRRLQHHVGGYFSFATDRASGNACVRAEFDLAIEQSFETVLTREDENNVG